MASVSPSSDAKLVDIGVRILRGIDGAVLKENNCLTSFQKSSLPLSVMIHDESVSCKQKMINVILLGLV